MFGIHDHQKSQRYVHILNARVRIGISQDNMSKKPKQYPRRNKFEMAAHELEMRFKKRNAGPTHPHSIETYANPFKRKII